MLVGAALIARSVVFLGPAVADWPPMGRVLCTSPNAYSLAVSSDGAGGAYVVWADDRVGDLELDIYASRVTASGEIAPGWPVDGLPVCTDPTFQGTGSVAPDGLGGVLVAWTDFRNSFPNGTSGPDIYAHRILADGTLAPGWPVDGVPVTRAPGYQSAAAVIADGSGGA